MGLEQIRKEQDFMKHLQETLQEAKKSGGRISRDRIGEIFQEDALGEAQLQQVEAYLQTHRITVGAAGPGESISEDMLPEQERDFLSAYLEILAGIPKLSDNVLEALKISAMAGEPSAQKELAEQMLGSVVDIARLYAGQGVSIEDLVGAGNEALVTGTALLGHLESPQEVEGELGRRIMDSMEDLISSVLDEKAQDREMEDLVNLVADKARELAGTLGRKVTARELAGEGEVTAGQIADARRLAGGKIEDLEG